MKANVYYAKGVFKTAFKIGCGLAVGKFVGELVNHAITGAILGTKKAFKKEDSNEEKEEEAQASFFLFLGMMVKGKLGSHQFYQVWVALYLEWLAMEQIKEFAQNMGVDIRKEKR